MTIDSQQFAIDFPLKEVYQERLAANHWGDYADLLQPGWPEQDLSDRDGLRIATYADRINDWIPVLPTLHHLKYLFVLFNINPPLFEAICQCRHLEFIEWERSSITDLSCITQLNSLSQLQITQSPRIKSFTPLSSLKGLTALGLTGVFREIQNLQALSGLSTLKGLCLHGHYSKLATYESLEPLLALHSLRYISFYNVTFKRDSIRTLTGIPSLKYIYIGEHELKRWSREDYKILHENLPNLKCDYIRRAATDRAFQKFHKIK